MEVINGVISSGSKKNNCGTASPFSCLFGSLSQTLYTESIPATQSAYEHTWVGSWAKWHLCRNRRRRRRTTTTTTLWLFKILLHLANVLHIPEATEILQYKENVEVVLLCSQECQFKGLDHRYCNLL